MKFLLLLKSLISVQINSRLITILSTLCYHVWRVFFGSIFFGVTGILVPTFGLFPPSYTQTNVMKYKVPHFDSQAKYMNSFLQKQNQSYFLVHFKEYSESITMPPMRGFMNFGKTCRKLDLLSFCNDILDTYINCKIKRKNLNRANIPLSGEVKKI